MEMEINIVALQELYESLIYFGFISINETFNQLTRLKHYLTSIVPLGYYYHFSELWTNLYGSTENLPLDNTLPVSPNHLGHSFPNTFMMNVCLYNIILNRKTHHIPWKEMALDLLDAIMCKLTAIYEFFMAAIRNPPKFSSSGIRRFRRFCIYAIRQPHHCLV